MYVPLNRCTSTPCVLVPCSFTAASMVVTETTPNIGIVGTSIGSSKFQNYDIDHSQSGDTYKQESLHAFPTRQN